jgi:glycosyltransferase involved in cell wall biosynthesis
MTEPARGGTGWTVAPPLTLAFLGDANSIHLRRWAAWFSAHGHRVAVLAPYGQAIDMGLPPAIVIERYVPYSQHRILAVGAIEARRSLRSVLAKLAPDVLHAHYLTVYGWSARLSGFHPYAVTVWGSDVLITARESLRARVYARLALSGAELVTGDSAELVRAAVAAGAHSDRTHEVQFGVDPVEFSPGPGPARLRDSLGLAARRIIFAPRRIAPLYRHDVLIDALTQLPADVHVVLTRHLANAEHLAGLERLARERGVSERLRILPALGRAEMVQVYRLADVVVSIPAQDGTPVSLLEALAVGRPVVASDLPSNREWLEGLDPTALVPVGDSEATARAINLVLGRPLAQQADLAERGRALIDRRANHETSMAGVEALYREVARHRHTLERRRNRIPP